MRTRVAVITVSAITVSAIARAADGTGPASAETEDGVVMIEGACRKLTTPTEDLSPACRDVPVSGAYSRQGRVDFHFGRGDGAVTFSGSAKEIRISDKAGVQRLDKVVLGSGSGARTIVAVGACRYLNALTPKPSVSCKAETEEGNFVASFDIVGGRPAERR